MARVDLKAERAASELVALAIHYEAGVKKTLVRGALRQELTAVAEWLRLDRVRV